MQEQKLDLSTSCREAIEEAGAFSIYPPGIKKLSRLRYEKALRSSTDRKVSRKCRGGVKAACKSNFPRGEKHRHECNQVCNLTNDPNNIFLRSLNEVHRSSTVGHALIHPIFIHRILLYLGLDGFPSGEPVHVIAPIGATFLRQRAAQLRVAPSHPRGASSSGVPPPPSFTGTAAVETSSAAANADIPPPTASDDSDIRHMLDHVLTIQAAQGQILVDVFDEIHALRAELAQFRPPPF